MQHFLIITYKKINYFLFLRSHESHRCQNNNQRKVNNTGSGHGSADSSLCFNIRLEADLSNESIFTKIGADCLLSFNESYPVTVRRSSLINWTKLRYPPLLEKECDLMGNPSNTC